MNAEKAQESGFGRKQLEFAVFCIENIAERLGKPGNEVYAMLAEKSDILDGYIIPCYDVLHTQGKGYIVNDILEYMRREGLAE
ncbi:hypothetical protein R80B4_01267 [Fibrobacteres bacterium R8-0-B4]